MTPIINWTCQIRQASCRYRGSLRSDKTTQLWLGIQDEWVPSVHLLSHPGHKPLSVSGCGCGCRCRPWLGLLLYSYTYKYFVYLCACGQKFEVLVPRAFLLCPKSISWSSHTLRLLAFTQWSRVVTLKIWGPSKLIWRPYHGNLNLNFIWWWAF